MMRVFERRYLFTGRLTLKTALHVGSGQATLSISDSPVARTPDERPFIPGSSFKGAFRSTVEKLAAAAGRRSCGLIGGRGCPGAPGTEQNRLNERRRDEDWDEDRLLQELREKTPLCDTCWLFGSPFTAARILFSDLYPATDEDGVVQVRDGVAIDRDSERAMSGLLYNYEVVASTTAFRFDIWLEEPTDIDLGLTSLGLSEYVSGFGFIGGKRSRGLGNCQIENLQVYELDLTNPATRAERLRCYLVGRTPGEKMALQPDANAFLNEWINRLLNRGED